MINEKFRESIIKYKNGNVNPLRELVNSENSIGSYDWYSISELMTEMKIMNMLTGDFYKVGTLDIFTEALSKTNKEIGVEKSFDKNLSIFVLAEDPVEFNKFISLYFKDTTDKENAISRISSWVIHSQFNNLIFWESFNFSIIPRMLEDDRFNEKQLLNIVSNINEVMDNSSIKQKNIIIEELGCDNFPKGRFFEAVLECYKDFESGLDNKSALSIARRTEESMFYVDYLSVLLEKSKLEKNLITQSKTDKKMKI
jgi:ribosomal protein L10